MIDGLFIAEQYLPAFAVHMRRHEQGKSVGGAGQRTALWNEQNEQSSSEMIYRDKSSTTGAIKRRVGGCATELYCTRLATMARSGSGVSTRDVRRSTH